LENPLFWVAMGCLIVAVLAISSAVALVVICRNSNRRERDDPLLSVNNTSPAYSRNPSESSNVSDDAKKYPVIAERSEKNGFLPDTQHTSCSHFQRV